MTPVAFWPHGMTRTPSRKAKALGARVGSRRQLGRPGAVRAARALWPRVTDSAHERLPLYPEGGRSPLSHPAVRWLCCPPFMLLHGKVVCPRSRAYDSPASNRGGASSYTARQDTDRKGKRMSQVGNPFSA